MARINKKAKDPHRSSPDIFDQEALEDPIGVNSNNVGENVVCINNNDTTNTTTTPTKKQKTDTVDDSNAASASASVIESAAVEAPAEITIEETLPTEEQLAVSTYQISMFLTLFLCCY